MVHHQEKLGIPGEIELAGRGIGMNAAKDAMKYRGKTCIM